MLEFHGFHGFLGGFSALESQTEMMVPNFVPFYYWKSLKFVGCLKIHVSSTMQNGQFCSVPQAHLVSKQVHHWVLIKCYQIRCTFEHLKNFKEEGQRLPLPCPGKEVDIGIVA